MDAEHDAPTTTGSSDTTLQVRKPRPQRLKTRISGEITRLRINQDQRLEHGPGKLQHAVFQGYATR